MARKMIVMSPDGKTPLLTEVLAHDERHLQAHLTEHPTMIPIEEFGWSGPLMVVGRECSLPSGAPDLVAVAPGGQILVAEFKTGPQNPDFRGALAQAIDYGADMWGMSYDEFEATVALQYFGGTHCPNGAANHRSSSLLAAAEATWGDDWPEEDRSQFCERLRVALEKGQFHFAVVAQRFTPTMERTAEYLNNTGTGAGVYLVELIRFTDGAGFEAFEARTVLKPNSKTGDGSGPSATLNRTRFLEAETDPDRRAWLDEFLDFCEGQGLLINWGTVGASIRVATSDRPEALSVAWVFPSGQIGWYGLTELTLGFDRASALATPSIASALTDYEAGLSKLSGGIPSKPKAVAGRTFDGEAAAANGSDLRALLATLVRAAASA